MMVCETAPPRLGFLCKLRAGVGVVENIRDPGLNRSQGLVTRSNDVWFWAQGGRGKLIVADDRGCELLHAREPGVKHTFCTR